MGGCLRALAALFGFALLLPGGCVMLIGLADMQHAAGYLVTGALILVVAVCIIWVTMTSDR